MDEEWKGFKKFPDDLHLIEYFYILKNGSYVGTYRNLPSYKSLNVLF